MTRRRFVQRKDGSLVEVSRDYVAEPRAQGLLIIPDIQPYKAIATDVATGKCPVIEGRRQHREFLKRNDLIEVGNEPFRPTTHRDDVPEAPMVSIEEMRRLGFVDESY